MCLIRVEVTREDSFYSRKVITTREFETLVIEKGETLAEESAARSVSRALVIEARIDITDSTRHLAVSKTNARDTRRSSSMAVLAVLLVLR